MSGGEVLSRCEDLHNYVPAKRSVPLRWTSPWSGPRCRHGRLPPGISIHRNHFYCSTLKVPLGSATCPGQPTGAISTPAADPCVAQTFFRRPTERSVAVERTPCRGCPRQDRRGYSMHGHRCGKRVFYKDEGGKRRHTRRGSTWWRTQTSLARGKGHVSNDVRHGPPIAL